MSRPFVCAGLLFASMATVLVLATAATISWGESNAAAQSRPQSRPAARATASDSGEAQWIWGAGSRLSATQPGTVYFRRIFGMQRPVEGTIEIACQESYELYVNGRLVGSGSNVEVMDRFDVASFLVDGRNTIAVKANAVGATAGLVSRVIIRGAGGPYVSFSTDDSWTTATDADEQWAWPTYDASAWKPAAVFGEFGSTPPWNNRVRTSDGGSGGRFTIPANFSIQRVASPDDTGSLTAITFDEAGNIIAAREGGPLLRLNDTNADGVPETIQEAATAVRNCQGILCVNGFIYAIGEGTSGTALYRLADENRDGFYESSAALLRFNGNMSEHGPHAVQLGPDGWLYVMIGNHVQLADEIANTSPFQKFYEGDLVQPRHEDAGGHAVGIKAPGGVIVRVSLDGAKRELFAGGFRNPYDLAFNADGELFTYESDMEWDEGAPWYRPTRVLHVPAGGEFGWRSGWAKWPDYFVDSLPAIVETGRGSPTGIEFYDHDKFPEEYRGAMFGCDWTQGRIVVVKLSPDGASYSGQAETFIEGKPLNVTDIAVGPTGDLYFSTGGRRTEGGVYRVTSQAANAPPKATTGIYAALRHPQLFSAFAREKIATIQEQLGEKWDTELRRVASDPAEADHDRVTAIQLMYLYGPRPDTPQTETLAADESPAVRAAAARLMGLTQDSEQLSKLAPMLADDSAKVRAAACEAMRRIGGAGNSADAALPLLADEDQYVAWSAIRLLQTLPTENWGPQVLQTDNPALFNHGAIALITAAPGKETSQAVIASAIRLMNGFVNDRDFIDMLRVMQLALLHGQLTAEDVPELVEIVAREYPAHTQTNPTGGRRINRELVRLLAHLNVAAVVPRMIEQLKSDEPFEDKLHLAAYASTMQDGWTGQQKIDLLAFLEQARSFEGGYSLSRYVENFAMDFASNLTAEEQTLLLENARLMPTAALGVLAQLPEKPDAETLARLRVIDQQMDGVAGEPALRVQTGIVAVFGRCGDEQSMQYLRNLFDRDPERRLTVAMGLAQQPDRANWPYLMRALPILEGAAAVEVLTKIQEANLKPDKPESARQVIICGLRLASNDSTAAIGVLEKWFQRKLPSENATWPEALQAWQEWFAVNFPELPPAALPQASVSNRWTLTELLSQLNEGELVGNATNGATAFTKGQCAKCHRFGSLGDAVGPDLTTVAQRFQKKEVLESIMYPSHVISDQYATKVLVTRDGRQIAGIVGSGGPGVYQVLMANGQKVRVPQDSVEEIVPSTISTMPEGLFNELTLQEIVDVFAMLYRERNGVARRQ